MLFQIVVGAGSPEEDEEEWTKGGDAGGYYDYVHFNSIIFRQWSRSQRDRSLISNISTSQKPNPAFLESHGGAGKTWAISEKAVMICTYPFHINNSMVDPVWRSDKQVNSTCIERKLTRDVSCRFHRDGYL